MEEYQSNEEYPINKQIEIFTQPVSHLEKLGEGVIKEEFEPKLEYLTGGNSIVGAVCKNPCHSPCQPPIPRPCTPC